MTVESNYASAIVLPGGCFKKIVPVFQPMRNKLKPIASRTHDFSRALSKLQVTACVLIGRSNYFVIGFSTVISKVLYSTSDRYLFSP